MGYHIALTGGIASGKTAVTDCFEQLEICVIDADLVARQQVAPGSQGLQKIVDYFGSSILDRDGNLDRALLRSIVFEDDSEREWLNKLLHPMIRQQMKQLREQADSPYTISAIPLLYETKQAELYHRVLLVDISEQLQIERLMQRDTCDLAQANAILASQASRQQRLSIADDIIDNSKDLHSLKQNVITLDKKYRLLANIEGG